MNSSWTASADGMVSGMRWSYEYSESSMLNVFGKVSLCSLFQAPDTATYHIGLDSVYLRVKVTELSYARVVRRPLTNRAQAMLDISDLENSSL